jgi:NAD(P)H dehydrogenase (quinone)
VVRDPIRIETLTREGCEIAVGDIRDRASLAKALAGASHVLVICPMNPKAHDAVAEHDNLTETIGSALESANLSSVLAASYRDVGRPQR